MIGVFYMFYGPFKRPGAMSRDLLSTIEIMVSQSKVKPKVRQSQGKGLVQANARRRLT